MKKHAKAWIKGLIKYGIGFGLLGYVLWDNWNPKGSSPGISGLLKQTPDFLLFAAVFLCGLFVVFTQYIRWYYLVRALDLPFTMGGAFRLGLVGTFYNSFLPGSVGGDLVKAYFIAKDRPGKRASAVATVIADRLVGLFGLIWFSALIGGGFWLAGNPLVADNNYLLFIIRVCCALTAAAVVGWVILGFLPQRRADRFARRLHGLPKVGGTLAEMWYAVWTYRQRPKVIYGVIALTAACHLVMVLMFHLAVRVFPTADAGTLAEHFVVAPIGYIAQAFFPAPGGVGGGEFIFGYLYTLLGRLETTGLVGRLTIRVVEWVIGLAGLVVFLRMRDELPVVEDEAEKEGYGGLEEEEGGSNGKETGVLPVIKEETP